MTDRRGSLATATARTLAVALGLAAAALAAALLVPAEPAEGAKKRKNGIIFKLRTSQGTTGRLTYLKRYEGEGRNFAQLEVEVFRNCTGPSGSYRESANVLLQGHTRRNGFTAVFHPQNTATDQYRDSARLRLRPRGRRGRLPRWRRATGTVRSTRSINDPFVQVSCDSGPVSITTTSSRRVRFGPRPPVIVVVP